MKLWKYIKVVILLRNSDLDKTLVIDLSDEEFKYINLIVSRYGFPLEVLLHRIFNWCFHSRFFWDKLKEDSKVVYQ